MKSGNVSIEDTLTQRRSLREFSADVLSLDEISQLLWAAEGITSPEDFRTAPSGGALYPLEIYLVSGNIAGLPPGVYLYNPRGHSLQLLTPGDKRKALSEAALDQECVQESAAVLVIAAIYGRTTAKYGERGIRYVHMEVGHVAQNVFLQTTAMKLGTAVVGAFHDERVKRLLTLEEDVQPLVLMPIGRP